MRDMPQPWLIVNRQDDGTWRYRWWDDVTDWVAADAPTRQKTFEVVQQVLPAILADVSRVKIGAGEFWESLPGLE